jgi:hypothetical protein
MDVPTALSVRNSREGCGPACNNTNNNLLHMPMTLFAVPLKALCTHLPCPRYFAPTAQTRPRRMKKRRYDARKPACLCCIAACHIPPHGNSIPALVKATHMPQEVVEQQQPPVDLVPEPVPNPNPNQDQDQAPPRQPATRVRAVPEPFAPADGQSWDDEVCF